CFMRGHLGKSQQRNFIGGRTGVFDPRSHAITAAGNTNTSMRGRGMRSEQDMFDLILDVARQDERIRAVYMNGSRTNPNAPKDIFQDYDIVYVVTETASFISDPNWVHVFGDLLIMQEPDKLDQAFGKEVDVDRSYAYLMLFADGNRIDLHIETKESMLERYQSDKLTVPLLDKDQCLPAIPDPTDRDYHVKK